MKISAVSEESAGSLFEGEAAGWVSCQLADCPTVSAPINSLVIGDTPRSFETNIEHVRVLVGVVEKLPPVLVHGPSGKVIDGAHRVRAAVLRGDKTIQARVYIGSLEDAFVLAVNLNSTHGLALSRTERTTASARIVRSHPQWSDRMIAGITGLSGGTIRKLRDSAVPDGRSTMRVGKDGRARPVDGTAGRLRACELLAESPTAPVRAIAKEAGVSASTVLDVRRRLAAGQDAVSPRRLAGGQTGIDITATLTALTKDPSIRQSGSGRVLLHWLIVSRDGMNASEQIIEAVPDHCALAVAKLARIYAGLWAEIATRLERRVRDGQASV
jgi:hypothetical protein